MSAAQYLAISFQFVQNAALLALGVIGYCQIRPWVQARLGSRQGEACVYGLVFGAFAIAAMLDPIDIGGGVRLDLRNATVVVSTLFGGVTAGAITTAIAAGYRAALGGTGAIAGVVGVIVTFAISAVHLAHLRRRAVRVDTRILSLVGVAIGLLGLVTVALLPKSDIIHVVIHDAAPVWMLTMPLTIVFLGTIILHFERSRALDLSLRERERELRAILDNAPLAIFLKDRAGRYRIVNRCYESWYEEKAAEIIGRTDQEIYPPEVARLYTATDTEVLQHGRVTQAEMGPDRRPRLIKHGLTTKFPIRDAQGRIVGIAGFILDLTDSKRAQEAVRRSEERLRALLENSNDIISVLDTEGRVIYRSPTKAEGLGYGRTPSGQSFLRLVHPEDHAAIAAVLREVAAVPGRNAVGRSRLRHADGSWRQIAWSMRNAVDVPGVNGIIANWFDVTETQRLEEQLLQAQKMEAVGQLAGGIAHDFNNILGAILGFAGFLVQDLPRGSPEHGFADRIVKAGERARDLVQQILSFSRRTDIKREPHDLVRLVHDMRDLLGASVPSSVAFNVHAALGPLVAEVSPAQISQILLNLVINANDALMGGPGTITVDLLAITPGDRDYDRFRGGDRTDHEELIVGSLDPGRPYAKFLVIDSGVGIEPAVLKHIFDPFFTTKGRGRGTGLGLSVVHGIVMSYEGACIVTSRRGAGTVFAVYLPLSRITAVPVQPVVQNPDIRGRERILVVDDELDLRDMLAVGLERFGYEVVALGDPKEALEAYTADPAAWDVVISDEVMPGMSGLALFNHLKALGSPVRFILCTGFSSNTTEEMARRAGADAYFVKPVSPGELAACVRRLVDAPDVPAQREASD